MRWRNEGEKERKDDDEEDNKKICFNYYIGFTTNYALQADQSTTIPDSMPPPEILN